MNDILDFTDYAKPVDFKYQEGVYRVPPFGKTQIETLMAINRKFLSISGKALEDFDSEDVDNISNEDALAKTEASMQYFNMQDEFLHCALLKKVEDSFRPIENGEIVNWPVKVKNRIMKIINDQMSTTIDEDVVTEKKS